MLTVERLRFTSFSPPHVPGTFGLSKSSPLRHINNFCIRILPSADHFVTSPLIVGFRTRQRLPKTNSVYAPENRLHPTPRPKSKGSYSNHGFSGVNSLLVSGSQGVLPDFPSKSSPIITPPLSGYAST